MCGRRILPVFAVLLLLSPLWAAAQATQPAAGVGVFVGQEMLRDYHPRSTLVQRESKVSRARVPAIDIHCHWTLRDDPNRMLAAMDDLNLSHAVNLSGGYGKDFDAIYQKFHTVDPERFVFFVNLDFTRIDDPGFGNDMCEWLIQAKAKGAKGLKIFKNLGLEVKDKSGKLVPVDDARLDAVWEKCGEIGFPVLIHSGDPVAFFQPVDEHNERWMQLKRNPDWSYFGKGLPPWVEIVEARNRVIARHPKTIFIVAHMAEAANDYAKLGEWLDKYPNMYVDLSARESEWGRQPMTSRRFLIKYADRILFGSDRYPGRVDQPRHRIYFRILETEDEYFDYYEHAFAPMGEWKVYGLSLPADVLEKIYRGNAMRLLGIR